MVPRLWHGVLGAFPRAGGQGVLAEMSGKGSGACKLSMRVSTAQARRDWQLNRGHVERCRFTSVLFWFFEPCPPRVAGVGDPGQCQRVDDPIHGAAVPLDLPSRGPSRDPECPAWRAALCAMGRTATPPQEKMACAGTACGRGACTSRTFNRALCYGTTHTFPGAAARQHGWVAKMVLLVAIPGSSS